MRYTDHYTSSFGGITLADDGENLTGLWFDGQKYFAAGLQKQHERKELSVFRQTKEWLDCYFKGQNPDFMPSLSLHGSAFYMAVREFLKQIPYGR